MFRFGTLLAEGVVWLVLALAAHDGALPAWAVVAAGMGVSLLGTIVFLLCGIQDSLDRQADAQKRVVGPPGNMGVRCF